MATAFDSPFFQELQLLFTLATWVGASPRRARRRPAKATRKPGQCPKLKYSSWNRENNSSKNTLHLCYDFTAALNTRQADPTVQWFLIMEKGLKMSLFVPSVFSRLRHEKKKKKKAQVFLICPACIYSLIRATTDCATNSATYSPGCCMPHTALK